MRVTLVVNPSASAVGPRNGAAVERALSAGHDLDVVQTKERGHATELARDAAAGGAEVVVVLGGDGTLNEGANGLVGTDAALATLPGGSTNVFARTIGLPNHIPAATAALVAALERRSVRRVGLGAVGERYFLFHVGIGFDAAVVEQVEGWGRWKRYAGHPLFVVATLSTWVGRYDRSRPPFTVHVDGDGPTANGGEDGGDSGGGDDGAGVEGYFTIVQNTNPYTFLGSRPLDVAPDAGFDRPLTAVTLRRLDLGFTLSVVAAALRGGGRLRRAKGVDYRSDVPSLTVRGTRGPVPYQVDGDFLGQVESLRFRYVPDALDIVFP